MLTRTRPADRVLEGGHQKVLTDLILNPGQQMSLNDFFSRWIPKLYGIDKVAYEAQWGTDFRTGTRLPLTWRQACFREIKSWNISLDSAKNWGADWEKATEMAKRYAYIMNAVLEVQFRERK